MGLDLRLQHKMVQQLVMTPQLQQAIKLLQLNHMEMAALLQEELEQNPVLEEEQEYSEESSAEEYEESDGDTGSEEAEEGVVGVSEQEDPVDWERYVEEHSDGSHFSSGSSGGEHLSSWENHVAGRTSLHDHLQWQVQMGSFEAAQARVLYALIEYINEDGYLALGAVEEVADALGVGVLEVGQCVESLQELDPPGVGARSLQECLRIQLRQRGIENPWVHRILDGYMDWVEKNRLQALAKEIGLTLEQLQEVMRVFQQLDPKPGRSIGGQETQYIVPDMYVYQNGDGFVVVLNDEGLPKLHISSYYRRLAQDKAPEEAVHVGAGSYIQEKLRHATWLLKSVHMRQKTLYRVMESIIQFQRPFFEDPSQPLRPLVLRDIAQDVGMHESTISRVTSHKYVHTPHGIFELKYFFNSAIACMDGEGIASESVRHHIQKLVGAEDRRAPLSDQKLAELLKREGIDIARRTVAKYREMLKIAPSSQRRRAL